MLAHVHELCEGHETRAVCQRDGLDRLMRQELDKTLAAVETARFLRELIGANETRHNAFWCYNHGQPTGASGLLHSDHVGRSDAGDQLDGRMILSFSGNKKDTRYKLNLHGEDGTIVIPAGAGVLSGFGGRASAMLVLGRCPSKCQQDWG
jgi:hypothetical protein